MFWDKSFVNTPRLYHWEGIDRQGNTLEGFAFATEPESIKKNLYFQEIILRRIKRKHAFGPYRIQKKHFVFLYLHLAILLKAGLTLVEAFAQIASFKQHFGFKILVEQIKQQISSGSALAEALDAFPTFFPAFYRHFIDLGERSGTLEAVLHTLSKTQEKQWQFQKKLKNLLSYPLFLCFFANLVFILLIIFVMPRFETLFQSMQLSLPSHIAWLFQLRNFLSPQHFTLFLAMVPFYLLVKPFFLKQLKHALSSKLVLMLPGIGPLLNHIFLCQFLEAFSLTYSAGLPLFEASLLVKKIIPHPLYEKALTKISKKLAEGFPLSSGLNDKLLFPKQLQEMIVLGENSGTLETLLKTLSQIYEENLNTAIENLFRWIEPFILIILGLIIASLMLALYLPIFNLPAFL